MDHSNAKKRKALVGQNIFHPSHLHPTVVPDWIEWVSALLFSDSHVIPLLLNLSCFLKGLKVETLVCAQVEWSGYLPRLRFKLNTFLTYRGQKIMGNFRNPIHGIKWRKIQTKNNATNSNKYITNHSIQCNNKGEYKWEGSVGGEQCGGGCALSEVWTGGYSYSYRIDRAFWNLFLTFSVLNSNR